VGVGAETISVFTCERQERLLQVEEALNV
jgi:hypothetical protein